MRYDFRYWDEKLFAYSTFHRICVHLAHVIATIVSFHGAYGQCPCVGVVMGGNQTMIVSYHMIVYGQNCLSVGVYPRYLLKNPILDYSHSIVPETENG